MKNKDLKKFREEKGYSQNEFATILGVSQPAICAMEKKPDLLVSNNLHRKFLEHFPADHNNNEDDPLVDFDLKISLRKSELDKIKTKKAVVDISNFFTVL